MTKQTTHKVTSLKSPITRKFLLLAGSLAGVFFIGGLSLIKGNVEEEIVVEETTVTED